MRSFKFTTAATRCLIAALVVVGVGVLAILLVLEIRELMTHATPPEGWEMEHEYCGDGPPYLGAPAEYRHEEKTRVVPVEPKLRVGVVSYWFGPTRAGHLPDTTDNILRYCARHGYTALLPHRDRTLLSPAVQSLLESSPNCAKAAVMEELLPQFDWLLWIDGDASIWDETRELEYFMRKDFVLATDYNGVNAGVYLIRNCKWSRKFLRAVDDRLTGGLLGEFQCMMHHLPEGSAIHLELRKPGQLCHVQFHYGFSLLQVYFSIDTYLPLEPEGVLPRTEDPRQVGVRPSLRSREDALMHTVKRAAPSPFIIHAVASCKHKPNCLQKYRAVFLAHEARHSDPTRPPY
mmetsp:Transcript_11673/g.32805  ORF Transcript_11673/g.32805 Transcript_11673/m.32805 type:complete len:347 (-) Transcript_11673:185-1225(-)